MSNPLDELTAAAVLGIDTLWGGDVMNPSGTGRFIADSWFSDEPLPETYSHATAGAVRTAGGLSASEPDLDAIDAYLAAVQLREKIDQMMELGPRVGGSRGAFLAGLGHCIDVMWDLAMEALDRGEPVPYERSVEASCAEPPSPSDASKSRARLGKLLTEAGYPAENDDQLLEAVDAWRSERMVPPATIPALSRALIAELEAGTQTHLLPHLPSDLHGVPRANVQLLPIRDAWFSGSMNYVGRARTSDGRPEYEATYEINASLEISVPELHQLVSHEVVPGHVTTFAYLQHLHSLRKVGFEATVLTMNSRYTTLAEGIANNAILMAYGVTELEDLPDDDLHIGCLLAELQDDAKNQASYLTWKEAWPQPEVAEALRREFVVSEERAAKLSGPWARHPLLGRMYLPSYRSGTRVVAQLRRDHPSEIVVPTLYGCNGIVDVATIQDVVGERR